MPTITGTCSMRHGPRVDPAALEQDEIGMVVQVNGKLRGNIRVPKSADKSLIEQVALSNDSVAKFVTGTPKTDHCRSGKLVNIVV